MSSSSKPAISPGLRRLGIAFLGAFIAAFSAVSKLLEGNDAHLDWKQLGAGAGVAVLTYAVKYRDDISPAELDKYIGQMVMRWFPERDPSLPPPEPEDPSLVEPER